MGIITIMDHEHEEDFERDSADLQLLEEAYIYLTEKKYPPGCNDTRKRVIRKKAQKFVVDKGELLYKQQKKGKVWLRYIMLRYIMHE